MITLYSGTPGSGKSLHVAEIIYRNMISGQKAVVCNFNINYNVFVNKKRFSKKSYRVDKSPCISIDNADFTVDNLVNYAKAFFTREYDEEDDRYVIKEGSGLVIIDECQLFFNSRTWQSRERAKWIWFFTQHRKFGYDVILITQFDRLIDRQIRGVIEYEVTHRRLGNFKAWGKLVEFIARQPVFVCNRCWYCLKGKKDGKISSNFFRGKPIFYRFYNTRKIFSSFGGGNNGW